VLPSNAFAIAVATMLFLGIVNPIVNGPLMAAVQAAVAPEMQGRVFTLIGTMAAAMSPIGLMIAGPISDKLGVQTWFIIGGVVTIAMGIGGAFIPAVMHFEDGRNGTSTQPAEAEGGSAILEAVERVSTAPVEVDYP
jgi:DHA3 family macrolide efflux protein-like MFS transporter